MREQGYREASFSSYTFDGLQRTIQMDNLPSSNRRTRWSATGRPRSDKEQNTSHINSKEEFTVSNSPTHGVKNAIKKADNLKRILLEVEQREQQENLSINLQRQGTTQQNEDEMHRPVQIRKKALMNRVKIMPKDCQDVRVSTLRVEGQSSTLTVTPVEDWLGGPATTPSSQLTNQGLRSSTFIASVQQAEERNARRKRREQNEPQKEMEHEDERGNGKSEEEEEDDEEDTDGEYDYENEQQKAVREVREEEVRREHIESMAAIRIQSKVRQRNCAQDIAVLKQHAEITSYFSREEALLKSSFFNGGEMLHAWEKTAGWPFLQVQTESANVRGGYEEEEEDTLSTWLKRMEPDTETQNPGAFPGAARITSQAQKLFLG
jgi:hypothetical protein